MRIFSSLFQNLLLFFSGKTHIPTIDFIGCFLMLDFFMNFKIEFTGSPYVGVFSPSWG